MKGREAAFSLVLSNSANNFLLNLNIKHMFLMFFSMHWIRLADQWVTHVSSADGTHKPAW